MAPRMLLLALLASWLLSAASVGARFDAFPSPAPAATATAAPAPTARNRPAPKPSNDNCLEATYKMDTTRFLLADGLPFFAEAGLDPALDPTTNVNQTYLLPTSDSIASRVQQLGALPQEEVVAIARTHTLAAPAGYAEFSDGGDTQPTLMGDTRALPQPYACTTRGSRVALSFYLTQESEYIVEAPGSSASILGPHDIPICGGNLVHVVDDLLFPCCFTLPGLRTSGRLAPYLPAAPPAAATPAAATLAAAPTVTRNTSSTTAASNRTRSSSSGAPSVPVLNAEVVLGTLRAKILALLQVARPGACLPYFWLVPSPAA